MRSVVVLIGVVLVLPFALLGLGPTAAAGPGAGPNRITERTGALEGSALSAVVSGNLVTAPARAAAATDLGEDVPGPDRMTPAIRAVWALIKLSPHVEQTSHPDALRMAVQAYYEFAARYPDRVRKPYLYFIDFGLDNLTPRGYVFDMESLEVVDGPFMVSHGRGSLAGDGVPRRFSNRPGSKATSLGLFVTGETYKFRGKANGRPYTSIGLRLEGESGSFNDNAFDRGIVVHGAPYVTAKRAGLSEGCPAMDLARAERLLPLLAHGSVVYQFSPHDEVWLAQGPWAAPFAWPVTAE